MPAAFDPAQGWLGSANNRPVADDYPYPLSGTWSEGFRLRRMGRLIEAQAPGAADRSTLRSMHADVHSTRAGARHVAELFANGLGIHELAFRPGQSSAVDFRRELVPSDPIMVEVKKVDFAVELKTI